MKMQFELLISDYAKELVQLLNDANKGEHNNFERGRRFGLSEAASLLVQEAKVFGCDIEELGLGILENRSDLG